MSNDIEYIEPTQEHIGQMVEVVNLEQQEWQARKLIAILDSKYEFHFLCEDGKFPNLTCNWKFARIPSPLTYAERQARCGLKVGDRVKFVRAWGYGEQGANYEFLGEKGGMSIELGKVGCISGIRTTSIKVQFTGRFWWLPYFVLEKVEDRAATCQDIDATVYVDGNPQDAFTFEHCYSRVNQPCRAVVRSGDKRFVYELNNLRVKE